MDAVVHSKALVSSIQGPIEDQEIRLERLIFEQQTGKVTRTVLSNIKQEFPRINEAYTGRPYRYAYSVSFAGFVDPFHVSCNTLLYHDLVTGSTAIYFFGANLVNVDACLVACVWDTTVIEVYI